jgi:hypothetical protein
MTEITRAQGPIPTFCRASLVKDDVKDEVSNVTPKNLILCNGVVNWDGVLKSNGRLKGDHFLSWIKIFIA